MNEQPIHALGERALLIDVESTVAAVALASWCRDQLPRLTHTLGGAGVGEVVAGAQSVLLDDLDDRELTRAIVQRLLLEGVPAPAPISAGEPVLISVELDGPDLDFVAQLWGTSGTGVIDRLCDVEFTSAFCGFAPGFAYLAGLPPTLAVPRHRDPRPRVPAGSVALADAWCGIYPRASPGGWQLIGRTDAVLWDADSTTPALLAPGVQVRFVAR